MIRATIATVLLIWLITLSSCQEKVPEPTAESKFKELNLAPMTLVIDEVSCKLCVKDMAEIYAKNKNLSNVVFLTADPFGRSLLELDSTVTIYPRRDFGSEANKLGSFLIKENGDTVYLNISNYKEVLGALVE
jgi:hypothetical protein